MDGWTGGLDVLMSYAAQKLHNTNAPDTHAKGSVQVVAEDPPPNVYALPQFGLVFRCMCVCLYEELRPTMVWLYAAAVAGAQRQQPYNIYTIMLSTGRACIPCDVGRRSDAGQKIVGISFVNGLKCADKMNAPTPCLCSPYIHICINVYTTSTT